MREILFRGQEGPGKWAYGYPYHVKCGEAKGWVILLQTESEEVCELDSSVLSFGLGEVVPVIEQSIGQFTGILDCNGNKIFEGDIVVVESLQHMTLGQKTTGYISYLDGAYTIVCGDRTALLFTEETNNHIKLVGNIYDNQELLKGGKQ